MNNKERMKGSGVLSQSMQPPTSFPGYLFPFPWRGRAGEIKKGKKNRNPGNEVVNAACFYRSSVAANCDLRISIGLEFLEAWGPFLESPETFRAHFGLHNSLYIFKAKASRGTKLCINFKFYSLYNI